MLLNQTPISGFTASSKTGSKTIQKQMSLICIYMHTVDVPSSHSEYLFLAFYSWLSPAFVTNTIHSIWPFQSQSNHPSLSKVIAICFCCSTCSDKGPCYFTIKSLAVLSPTYLLLMALAGGVAAPGGLFMPSIMVLTRSLRWTATLDQLRFAIYGWFSLNSATIVNSP